MKYQEWWLDLRIKTNELLITCWWWRAACIANILWRSTCAWINRWSIYTLWRYATLGVSWYRLRFNAKITCFFISFGHYRSPCYINSISQRLFLLLRDYPQHYTSALYQRWNLIVNKELHEMRRDAIQEGKKTASTCFCHSRRNNRPEGEILSACCCLSGADHAFASFSAANQTYRLSGWLKGKPTAIRCSARQRPEIIRFGDADRAGSDRCVRLSAQQSPAGLALVSGAAFTVPLYFSLFKKLRLQLLLTENASIHKDDVVISQGIVKIYNWVNLSHSWFFIT